MNPLPLILAEFRRSPLGCAAIIALIAVAVALGVVVCAHERALHAANYADAASIGAMVNMVRSAVFSFDGLIVTAVLLVIVAELSARHQSIGALRALGAPPMFVFVAVWLQGALLIALGDVVGVGLGFAAAGAMNALHPAEPGLTIDATIGVPELVLAGAFLGAGSLFAAAPSLPLLRMSAARLLRLA